jgi:nucleoid-associated protein YgaU
MPGDDRWKDVMEDDLRKEMDEFRKRKRDVSQPGEEAPVEEKSKVRTYVVQRGDSLSKIAEEVYGDAGRWREIYEANQDQIKDPNLIRPGWELRIP